MEIYDHDFVCLKCRGCLPATFQLSLRIMQNDYGYSRDELAGCHHYPVLKQPLGARKVGFQ